MPAHLRFRLAACSAFLLGSAVLAVCCAELAWGWKACIVVVGLLALSLYALLSAWDDAEAQWWEWQMDAAAHAALEDARIIPLRRPPGDAA